MYIAPPMPLTTSPSAKTTTCQATPCTSGVTASVALRASPIQTEFAIVPSPGHWRSGTHNSSTANDVMIVTVPMSSPVCSLTPMWNTSHGSRPTWLRTNRPIAAPYSVRPTNNWGRRSPRRPARSCSAGVRFDKVR